MTLADSEKLSMLLPALEQLTAAVAAEPVGRISRATVEAFHKAQGALDGLRFVEKLGAKT